MPAVHPYAAREPSPKCADCLRLEAIVADLAALAETLRRSRDSWRGLALEGAGREEVADVMLADHGRSSARSLRGHHPVAPVKP